MDENHDDRQSVYEIGFLIATSIAEENVPAEYDKIKKIVADAGASVIADDAPHKMRLAYTMRRKTVAGSYESYDEAYFGWVKFELGSSSIEAVKKEVETLPSVLRMLLITTVSEPTYLGKKAPAIAAVFSPKRTASEGAGGEAKKNAAPATVEEMDKSIDDMVKEA